MYPVRLRLHNFLSFQDLDYDFRNGPTLLIGENLSDEGQESNGSGKTAIQSALEKCWLDYTSRKKVRDIDLVRRGEEEATVESWIYCPVRKETLYIKRVIPIKGSNKLQLQINDKDVSFATVNDGNNFIINWIGISKDDLSNYYIVNKERFLSFFSSSNTQKLQLLSRISNTEFLSLVDVDVKKKQDEKVELKIEREKELNFVKGQLESLEQQFREFSPSVIKKAKEEKISLLKESIEKNEDRKVSFESRIERLNEEIEKKKISISKIQETLSLTKKNLKEKNKELDQKSREVEKLESGIEEIDKVKQEKENELSDYKETRNEIDVALRKIKAHLAGAIICPKCHHEFIVGEDIDVEEEKNRIVQIQELREQTSQQILDLEIEYNSYCEKVKGDIDKHKRKKRELRKCEEENDEIISQIRTINRQIEEALDECERNKKKIDDYKKEIEELEEKNENLKVQIKEVEEFSDVRKGDEIKEKITQVKIEQRRLEEEIETLDKERREYSSWLSRFKEFKIYLSNTALEEIQYHCNEILRKMESDLTVNIEGFKKKADGSLKDEITPIIIRDEPLSFGTFSGGERGRIEYAMILSQQQIINQSNPYGGLQFLFTDEIAEGIDALGLRLLAKSLSEFNFPILITTHVVNQAIEVNILKVIKENNISRIEYER